MTSRHHQLITTITNFDRIAELEDLVFDLQDEVSLLQEKTAELQTVVERRIESYNFIIQSIMVCLGMLFVSNWINQ
jgi:hypothetical protein